MLIFIFLSYPYYANILFFFLKNFIFLLFFLIKIGIDLCLLDGGGGFCMTTSK